MRQRLSGLYHLWNQRQGGEHPRPQFYGQWQRLPSCVAMCACAILCRRRGADSEHGDDAAATLPCQRCADNPALFAAVPLHQHVAVQLRGPAAETAAVLARLGLSFPPAAGTCAGVGRRTRARACRRLSSCQSCTGAVHLFAFFLCFHLSRHAPLRVCSTKRRHQSAEWMIKYQVNHAIRGHPSGLLQLSDRCC